MRLSSLTEVNDLQTREKVKLLVAICDAGRGEKLAAALRGAGATMTCLTTGQGTAKPAWLQYLGLTETHKDVAIATLAKRGPRKRSRRSRASSRRTSIIWRFPFR